jgi:chemosensory pili system protein ChpA (sensor histidine kinase/response regulator)
LVNLLAQRVNRLQQSNQELRRFYDREQVETLAQPTALNRLFDRLEMDRYSSSHLLFQELMEKIVQIQEVSEDIDFNLDGTERSARQVTRTSQLLQNQLTQIRMRPFSDLAGRFTRFVREMGLKYDKLVDLKISGGNTLIDRTILDALSDPLLHLIRNAFDHGIETPTTRSMLGKSPTGAIELSATYRGNQTIITLRDDGAGINTEKIRAKALEMGLTPGSETDLLNLIFEPGFSTAAQITDLSGLWLPSPGSRSTTVSFSSHYDVNFP